MVEIHPRKPDFCFFGKQENLPLTNGKYDTIREKDGRRRK
jgi:hypothetical protein